MKIYLASKSPRRQELLNQINIDFELLYLDVPELQLPEESAAHYSKRVTKDKMEAAWNKLNEENRLLLPVLAADTEVVLDGKILGKAADYDAAFLLLKSLSERTHEVLTSIGLKYHDYQKIVLQKTKVTFDQISGKEIHRYLKTGNYRDKSGAYGIQSEIGQFISRIDGCFYSVMGLPLNSLRLLLEDLAGHVKSDYKNNQT